MSDDLAFEGRLRLRTDLAFEGRLRLAAGESGIGDFYLDDKPLGNLFVLALPRTSISDEYVVVEPVWPPMGDLPPDSPPAWSRVDMEERSRVYMEAKAAGLEPPPMVPVLTLIGDFGNVRITIERMPR